MRNTFFGILFFLLSAATFGAVIAPPDTLTVTDPYKGRFYAQDHGITIVMNLYCEDIIIPGYTFLGPTNGYMKGDSSRHLYGVWILTSFVMKPDHAVLRFSNDLGSESQTVNFYSQDDGTFRYHAIGGNEVRKSSGKKLIKIAGDMTFIRR